MLISRKGRHSKYNLQDDFANIKDAISECTHDVRGKVAEILLNSVDDVKERSNEAKEYVAKYVSKKPFKSLGVAVLIGALMGFLFHK